jgi:hypothetical protein
VIEIPEKAKSSGRPAVDVRITLRLILKIRCEDVYRFI